METTLEKNIIALNDQLLEALLAYRRGHPDFVFSIRSRGKKRGEDDEEGESRLERGYWFPGSHYVFIGFYTPNDWKNKTRSFGFVANLQDHERPENYLEWVFTAPSKEEHLPFYEGLYKLFPNATRLGPNKARVYFPNTDYVQNLIHFLETDKPKVDELIRELRLEKDFFIAPEKFQRNLERVMELRQALQNPEHPSGSKSPTGPVPMHLNTILFGPPGTGKTFNSVNHAISILESKSVDAIAREDRESVKTRFDRYQQEGRIVFTTFHQSMSYEDFVEGIKPEMIEEQIAYEIKPGIFKMICTEAAFAEAQRVQGGTATKTLGFSELYDQFVDSIEKSLASPGTGAEVPTKSGGYIEIEGISPQGNILVKHKNGSRSYTISKDRLTVLDQNLGNLDEISNVNNTFRDIIGGSNSSAYFAILKAIRSLKPATPNQKGARVYSFADKMAAVKVLTAKDYQQKAEPFILIIDEINRGNIAQIFGELITLIEEDKRLGRPEALEATLPYSKDKFGVPPNLYIIGTMNTADRSVEALDTALRRRFSFQEMQPKPDLIATAGKLAENGGVVAGVSLPHLLTTINKRIEKLLDKDHLIGHSYLMEVDSLPALKSAFQNKIIPLLQEYFYGDFGKIGLVLGTGFFETDSLTSSAQTNFFADFPDYETVDLLERKVYRLMNVADMSDEAFLTALEKARVL